MGNAEIRRQRLDFLMRKYGLTSKQVGRLIHRGDSYVRQYRAGLKEMPECLLRLLELEIKYERGVERAQMGNVAAGG
jgi:hypothetical protein